MSERELTLTVKETGKLLRIGRTNMYSAVKNGQIPSIRIGKRILIPKAALDKLLHEPPLFKKP